MNINKATLAQLSVASLKLWEALDSCESEIELEQLLKQQFELQELTEVKVDAIAYVHDQLKIDLESWTARLESVINLHSKQIETRIKQVERLKRYLLRLHNLGVLPDKLLGKERRIQFRLPFAPHRGNQRHFVRS